MARKSLSNWAIETCATIGTGNLTLTGAVTTAQTRFRDGLDSGSIWYTIVDGSSREAGYGQFNGVDSISRTEIHSTLVNGVYNAVNPQPLVLTGAGVVSGTYNAEAYQRIADDVDFVMAGYLTLVTTSLSPVQKEAIDASVTPSATNRLTVNDELVAVSNQILNHEGKSANAHPAAASSTNTTQFNKNLSSSDTDVQKALDTIDNLNLGDGGGGGDHNDLTGIQGGAPNDYHHLTQNNVNKLDGIENNAKADQDALTVPTDTTQFNKNLSSSDTDVQKALDTIDNLNLGDGGGGGDHNDLTGLQGGNATERYHLLQSDVTKLNGIEANAKDDQDALTVPTDVTQFSNNLSSSDTDVQKALDTIDNLNLGGGGGGGIGHNLLMNSDFNIWQRGTNFDAGVTAIYTADRWFRRDGTNDIVERVALLPVNGDPMQAHYCLQYTRLAFSFASLETYIEGGLQATSGKTVTLSYWVRANKNVVSDANRPIILAQLYSNSVRTNYNLGNLAVTTDWVKHEHTVTLDALTSINVDVDSNLALSFGMSAMDAEIQFAQLKLEIGSAATEYEVPDFSTELAKCQRYFINDPNGRAWGFVTNAVAGSGFAATCYFPVTMRIYQPALNVSVENEGADITIIDILSDSPNNFEVYVNFGSPDLLQFMRGSYTADADYYY